MERRLQYLLDQVNAWLRFAEAKNGALLATDAALIFGGRDDRYIPFAGEVFVECLQSRAVDAVIVSEEDPHYSLLATLSV